MKNKSIKELKKLSPILWLSDVLVNWGILIMTIYLAGVLHHFISYFVAILIIGSRQHSISILGHDGSHWLVCKNKRLNDFLTNVFTFLPLGACLGSYRKFHFAHHAYTGTQKDPELIHKLWGAPEWDLPRSENKKKYLLLKDIFGFSAHNIAKAIQLTGPSNPFVAMANNILPISIAILLFVTGNYYAILLWYGSLLTSFWAIFRLRMWSEHLGTLGTHRIKANFWSKLFYLPVNTWCHWEHHKWPSIPYYNLPAARLIENKTPVHSLKQLNKLFAESEPISSGYPLIQEDELPNKGILNF